MDRKALEAYITEAYGTDAEFPWECLPGHAVFRHRGNQKWFALLMNLPKTKLGMRGEGTIDVVNLKCDPILIGSLRAEPGFYPAYHMNKTSWITVALDGRVADDTLKGLLDMSYEATAAKAKRPKTASKPK